VHGHALLAPLLSQEEYSILHLLNNPISLIILPLVKEWKAWYRSQCDHVPAELSPAKNILTESALTFASQRLRSSFSTHAVAQLWDPTLIMNLRTFYKVAITRILCNNSTLYILKNAKNLV
jgi:hypothetical protein